MTRRHRFRRLAKPTCLVLAVLIGLAWIASEWWYVKYAFAAGPGGTYVCVGEGVFCYSSGLQLGDNNFLAPRPRGLIVEKARVTAGDLTPELHGVEFTSFPGFFFLLIPLWIPLLLSAFGLILLKFIPHRPRPGHCSTCGYNLNGNVSGVCSECGAVVDRGAAGPIA